MKKPQPPPNFVELFQKLKIANSEKLLTIYQIKPTDYKNRYLHWRKVKYMNPPAELTHEEHWLGIKLARLALRRELPFEDDAGMSFVFGAPNYVLEMLHFIDRHASGAIVMAEPIATSRMRDMYLVKSLIEEAVNSSQLEGASTTKVVAREMIRRNRKPRNRSEQMIFNNYQVMNFVRDNKDEELTPEMIAEIHRIVTHDTLDNINKAGTLRENDDPIVVVDDGSEEILHRPPPASQLPERLRRLCDFANNSSEMEFIHPVIRSILLHFMLAYDHPFADGNGRTARALFYWSMAKQGYWLIEFISISEYLKAAPAQYGYAFLHSETDDNDATYFIIHQLEIIQKAIKKLQKYLARKIRETQEALTILEKTSLAEKLNHRQIALLEHGLKNPNALYLIKEHQTLHNITYQTARSDLMQLFELGLFQRFKDGQTFVFLAPANLRERIEAQ